MQAPLAPTWVEQVPGAHGRFFAPDAALPLQGLQPRLEAGVSVRLAGPRFYVLAKLGSQLKPAAASILFPTVCKCFFLGGPRSLMK